MSYTPYYQTTLQHHIHKFYTCNGFPCQIFFYAYHLINFYLDTFYKKLHELLIMVPIAFVLEFFVVSKLATALAFTVVKPDDRPQIITYAISICIWCIMCPIMSLVATLLFKENKSFGTWIQTWAMNFPMALLYSYSTVDHW